MRTGKGPMKAGILCMPFAFPGSILGANGCGLSTRYGQRGRFRMAMSVSAMGHPRGAVGVSGHSIVAHAADLPHAEAWDPRRR